MRMLVHRDPINTTQPFILDDIKAHVRADFDDDDAALINMGLTAAAEIEHFAQIALLIQSVRVTVFHPRYMGDFTLPVGPVLEGHTPTVTVDGDAFTGFDFEPGLRPYIAWHQVFHRLIPTRLVVSYTAGFGGAASDVPADLRQAIMDQAALHYDGRSPMDAKSFTTSPHMARVGARYRGVQV